ncbi:hypothetical protein NEFER03_2184 [Nematocida sp. LUAm3]|nr:hypothetical protein NEFER03_2184 [Nematocida sp. LUAm3]KAI5176292.1 hypothetical protein NEFER02_2084 [Nematocida sp. LUAm2]KAI5179236.1 hypothetical protein NEFER01_2090 [Nematocida sp. LUAm1]
MNSHKAKKRIKAYRMSILLLEQRIKKLQRIVDRKEESNDNSMEEGEIRERKPEKKRRKEEESQSKRLKVEAAPENEEEEYLEKMVEYIKKSPVLFLKEFFDQLNVKDIEIQKKLFSIVSMYLDHKIKYVILHDILLFSSSLNRYVLIYRALYPNGVVKDGSEVSTALYSIYRYLIGKEKYDEISQKCIDLHKKYSSLKDIFSENGDIDAIAFDGATSIRLYSKVLDWDWTYNLFIREHLFPSLSETDKPFSIFVLGCLYSEWYRLLSHHKSLEYLIQVLDKVAGIGQGEDIISSPYSLNSQLSSALFLKQFRPGASVKWQRQRIEASSETEKKLIENIWKIIIF